MRAKHIEEIILSYEEYELLNKANELIDKIYFGTESNTLEDACNNAIDAIADILDICEREDQVSAEE